MLFLNGTAKCGNKDVIAKKLDSDELGDPFSSGFYEDQSAANNSVQFFDQKVKRKQFYIERLQEIADRGFLSLEGKNESKTTKNVKKV